MTIYSATLSETTTNDQIISDEHPFGETNKLFVGIKHTEEAVSRRVNGKHT